MPPSPFNLVAVTGPTASGKTAFAAHLASEIGGEIISADSRQVYRRMDLGTGKDYKDYIVNGTAVKVHLTDITDAGYKYSVYEFQRDFLKSFEDISGRNKIPVLCGGTGMYIEAATRQYRLEPVAVNDELRKELSGKSLEELKMILGSMKTLHNKTDVDDKDRALRAIEIETYYHSHPREDKPLPPLNTLYLGIIYDREVERRRITERLNTRLEEGMIEEVKQLLESGIGAETLMYYGLEYRYITRYLQGETDFDTMKSGLNTAIHQFAKRQRTWFRKMEREGLKINWISGEMPMKEKIRTALALYDRWLHERPLM